jgi:hypothetical protein
MSNWSFWDWLTYTCIGVAALVLALDQAIKGSPVVLGSLSGLLARSTWNYAPLALIGLSSILLVLRQLHVLGAKHEAQRSNQGERDPEPKSIKTALRLQFFGDYRIPHEISSDNVASCFAYYSPSLSITPKDASGNTIAGGMEIPPNWAIFLALDKPAKFKQAIVSFSNPEVMPITDVHLANSRVIVTSTRGQVPAGVLAIQVVE